MTIVRPVTFSRVVGNGVVRSRRLSWCWQISWWIGLPTWMSSSSAGIQNWRAPGAAGLSGGGPDARLGVVPARIPAALRGGRDPLVIAIAAINAFNRVKAATRQISGDSVERFVGHLRPAEQAA
jgi:hypothetical protein